MPSSQPKPSHLSGEYGAWFKDPFLVEAYPARPLYPMGVIQLLAELAGDAPHSVLDVGCGTGELTRRLAPLVDRVDAVDFSQAMLDLARQLEGGGASNVSWVLSAAEEIELTGPYALISAGESLHWMDWDVVMPRFAALLTPSGVLAIVERSWDSAPQVWDRVRPLIEQYSPVRDYRSFDLVAEPTDRDLFEVHGEQTFGPEGWHPTVDEYLECRHSQRGLSRTHMGPEAVRAFDSEAREALTGDLAEHDGRLELSVEARVTWGRPHPPRDASR